jgi:hypothetical protein
MTTVKSGRPKSVFAHPSGGAATTWFAVITFLLAPTMNPVPLRSTLFPLDAFPRTATMTIAFVTPLRVSGAAGCAESAVLIRAIADKINRTLSS